MKRFFLTLLLVSLFVVAPAQAEIEVPSVISDHMVLQVGRDARLWGTAEPGETIFISLTRTTARGESEVGAEFQADADGHWQTQIPGDERIRPTGSVWSMTITGSASENTIEVEDILVGEVWVASGQSNMAWTVNRSANAQAEIAAADYPQIRMWTARHIVAGEPQADVPGQWVVCSPQTVANFSAVGYFFARSLHQGLDMPVGILHSSWGGTPVEAWTSRPKLDQVEWAGPILQRFDDAMEHYGERIAEYERKMAQFRESQNGPAVTDEERGFVANDFDDAQWETMQLPQTWEQAGLEDLDGVVWYRRSVTIPQGWAGQALVLELGPIDDFDTTYFDGARVGRTGPNVNDSWQTPRSYSIPANKVEAGEFTIAIRVVDPHGGGGFGGEADQMQLRPADEDVAGDPISLSGDWRYHITHRIDPANIVSQAPAKPFGPDHPHSPAGLYNAMIAPITPYTIRGAIWYQGESNASRAQQYQALFPAMIQDWRQQWDQGDFPFLFVQLANFRRHVAQPVEEDWAYLREAQTMVLDSLENTGMAVITDIGNANNIHPTNKQDVGARLARWALVETYGQEGAKSGPLFAGDTNVVDGKMLVQFDAFGSTLAVGEGQELGGFEIAGEDQQFFNASAQISETDGTVTVWSDEVPAPVAVRYAWKNNPSDANLVNEEGLPASPFRTDDWAGPTDGRR